MYKYIKDTKKENKAQHNKTLHNNMLIFAFYFFFFFIKENSREIFIYLIL